MIPNTARDIARAAHNGQTYGTQDFFRFHVCKVASRVLDDRRATFDAYTVAWLHDVLEDTDVTPAQLVRQGITYEQFMALWALTRYAGEEYCDYLDRVITNPIAALVKFHDLEANLAHAPPADLLKRYENARWLLDNYLKSESTL